MIRWAGQKRRWLLAGFLFACALSAVILSPDRSHAICATVKIEIQQELTLERQAFDAHMRINNGLSAIPIENVAVTVHFSDEAGNPVVATSNPDDTSALFYIRIDSMDRIDNMDGTGSVAPETSADIHWLIIPSPGASNGLESGTLYYVGATLTYTVSGKTETIDVSPDYIFVKPMPQLVLDYFLPTDVYGDDAHTEAIEPPVPFNLGLRVSNKGDGYARSLKIESAQPKIVDNELGLMIGFQIDGSKVNGDPASDSLLVDFGDVAPHSAGTARWIMSCSLSGQFISFGAEFSHADELGGQLTSLIAEEDVNTHFLVHDVLVDAEGRDAVEDFLARDDDVLRVYESDNTETLVTDQSSFATLIQQSGSTYQLTAPATNGFMHVQLSDPYGGAMVIQQVMRSDGKLIKPANAWLSKTRSGSGPWEYSFNVFDHNSTGSYSVVFQSAANVPQAPVIAYIPERSRVEGVQLSFLVEASDPNGTIPALSVQNLPIGATFQDQGDGTGIFDWTPTAGQAGKYAVKFFASDGTLESSRQAIINVLSAEDADGDGMTDSWEIDNFGHTDRDGSGDYDDDGVSDLDEYLNGFDPTVSDSAPGTPEIIYPQIDEDVDLFSPTLEILNSVDPEGDAFTYTFEVYADEAFSDLIASQNDVAPQAGTTKWPVPATLEENTSYFWRVKAQDHTGSSSWVYGRFFVNTRNEPPSAPGVSYPADGTGVDTTTPILEITNGADSDLDELIYYFEVFADIDMAVPVEASEGVPSDESGRTTWLVTVPLQDESLYYWRAVAIDGNGEQTPGPLSSFRVDTLNRAPGMPSIQEPADASEVVFTEVELVVADSEDPDGDTLTYRFEIDTVPTFDGPNKLTSDPLAPEGETTRWIVSGLLDDTMYYWRVNASDGGAESPWGVGRFFVNTLNDGPSTPGLANPADNAWVGTQTPQLSVHGVSDSDGDALSYRFEVYTDPELTQPVGYTETQDPVWSDMNPLPTGQRYYWRSQAVDEHGVVGDWSETGYFFVKLNSVDLPPQFSFIDPSAAVTTNAQTYTLRWSDADPDSSAHIALYYDDDAGGADGLLVVENLEEDQDGTADTYAWDISTLEGAYYVYAVITDGSSSRTVYAAEPVTIDHTPPSVTVDPPGGTYADALSVSLSVDEGAQIYYTLDGSDPDTGSFLYTAPIDITEDTSLRCMAVDIAGNASAVIVEEYTFATDITVSLRTDKSRTLDGIRVYAFTDSGSYTGRNATSDGDGEAHFNPDDFTPGDYKFRVDYLGHQFWSDSVQLPDTRTIDVVIAEEPVTITVDTAAGPSAGVRVYLFGSGGSYLGQYLTTDAGGQVVFNLPVGVAFTFRADLFGSQYWSDATTVQGGTGNAVPVHAGGGRLGVEVIKAANEPIAGMRVYLFSTAGSYLGHYATTDAAGAVSFDVPEGDYKVRVDYLGYQFWSADISVSTDTQMAVTIPHQPIQVSVQTLFQSIGTPIENVRVYLFSAAGSYLGQYLQTDSQGRVVFDLPQQAYKVRADHMGQQYWSDDFNWQDPVVSIPMSDAQVTVTGAGSTLENVRVYLFTAAGSYLGQYGETDANGQVRFHLPEGRYTFRADYQGNQYWSIEESLAADQLHDIGISTGGGSFVFTLWGGPGEPLGNTKCYVFDENSSYLGLQGTTDSAGQVTFDLSDGQYRIRADYLGHQFWSDLVQVPDTLAAELTIAHTAVGVNVQSAGQPAPGVRVYLFKADGAYLGKYLETDASGTVTFDLPAGVAFMFRADLLGHQYWSDLHTVSNTGPDQVAVDAGGGRLLLTVDDGGGNAMPDLNVYLFSEANAYLGQQRVTDAAGRVAFEVPAGDYKMRVDYLGYHFWTDTIPVSQDTDVAMPIGHQDVDISVQGRFQSTDQPLSGVKVYLFTPTRSYLGRVEETAADGTVRFNLPGQDYMVRADYMGRQYWSQTFNRQNTSVTIPMADVQVTVTGAGLPREDINVYLFSESDAYLGINAKTDVNGQVGFRLPAGSYKFRAEYQGNQYWSAVEPLTADQSNPVVISVGGGTFTVNVRQDAATPMAGLRGYVFNASDAYLGLYGATDDQGRLFFDLADGTFKFRADYLGYQYWSQTVTVPAAMTTDIEIPHQQIVLTLSGNYLGSSDPLSGVRLYLFSAAGSYMGVYQTTDAGGQAGFTLPDQEYKVRADYLGGQYWSSVFRSQDTAVDIAQGAVDLRAHRSGTEAVGVRIYLFTAAGAYLGRYQLTDADGLTAFILPEGDYRFRADIDGIQRWSQDVTVSADQTSTVEIDLDQ